MKNFLILYTREASGGAAHEPELLRALEHAGEVEPLSPCVWTVRLKAPDATASSLLENLVERGAHVPASQLTVAELTSPPVTHHFDARPRGRPTPAHPGSPLGTDPETLTY